MLLRRIDSVFDMISCRHVSKRLRIGNRGIISPRCLTMVQQNRVCFWFTY